MIQFKRGTSSQWTSNNPTLSAGQPGVEFDNTQDITKIKIGDGSSTYSNLPYISANPVINQTSGTGFNDMSTTGFYDMVSVSSTGRPSSSTAYKTIIFGDSGSTGYASQFAISTSSTNGSLFYRTNNTSLSSTSAWQTILKTSETAIDTPCVPLVTGSTGNVDISAITSAQLRSFPEAETGTWSPTISGADITAISSTYVKIGNYVYLAGGIRFTEQLPNTTDSFIIGGLPFAPNQAAPSSFTMSTLMNGSGAFVGSMSGVINIAAVFTGSSFYVVRQNTTGGYSTINLAQVSTFFGTGYLYFQVHYRT